MSSLVELIFTAVGTEEVARSVGKVNASLGDMAGSLGRMATAALGVGLAWDKVKGAIDEAASFEHLAARTGENVRNLVVLDQAFRNAGLGAEMIGLSANMLQRSLGGVNDMGGKTETAFRRIGTSIAELKPLAYAQQLDVLSRGFANLANQSDKVSVARELFGRGGGQMLQLLGDPEALARAQEQAGGLAGRIAQNARAAHELEVQFNGVTAKLREMWQVAAAQLLPTLQTIAGLLGHLSLGGAGAFLGASGAGLLGSGALLYSFGKVDSALYGLLAKMEEGTARSFVRGVSNGMADAAAWNPYLLAAAVTAQLVLGIIAAWNDYQIQKMFAEAQGRGAPTQAVGDRAAQDLTSDQQAATLAAAQAKLDELMAERKRLAAQLEANRKGTDHYDPDAQDKFDTVSAAATKLGAFIKVQLANQVQAAANLATNQLNAMEASLKPLVDQITQITEKNDKLRFETLDPAQQLLELRGRRASVERQLSAPTPAGLSPEATAAKQKNLENELFEIVKKETEATAKLTEEKKKTAEQELKRQILVLETSALEKASAGDEAGAAHLKREIEALREKFGLEGQDLILVQQLEAARDQADEKKQAQAAARKQIEAQKLALENQLTAIRENLITLEADYTRTAAEKWGERKKAIAEEIAALQTALKLEQDRVKAATDLSVKNQHESAAAGLGKRLGAAQGEQGRLGADPMNFLAQLKSKLTAVQEQMGTWQQSIASGFGEAFANASAGLQKLIGDTTYWSQKLGNIAGPIMGGITKAIADMFTTWIVNRGMAAVKNILFSAEEGTADTVAKTPGAVLTSISSFGIAAAVGVAAILAAMAAFGGFKTGGPTGRGGSNEVMGVVHANEWVAPAWMTRHPLYGAQIAGLEAARQGAPGFSSGGFFGGLFKQFFFNPLHPEVGLKRAADNLLHPAGQNVFKKMLGLSGQSAGGYDFSTSAPAGNYDYYADSGATRATRATSATSANSGVGGSAASGRDSARNIHIYLDRSAWLDAVQNDLTGLAHEVYEQRSRA